MILASVPEDDPIVLLKLMVGISKEDPQRFVLMIRRPLRQFANVDVERGKPQPKVQHLKQLDVNQRVQL